MSRAVLIECRKGATMRGHGHRLVVNAFTQQTVKHWLERAVDKFSDRYARRHNPRWNGPNNCVAGQKPVDKPLTE